MVAYVRLVGSMPVSVMVTWSPATANKDERSLIVIPVEGGSTIKRNVSNYCSHQLSVILLLLIL